VYVSYENQFKPEGLVEIYVLLPKKRNMRNFVMKFGIFGSTFLCFIQFTSHSHIHSLSLCKKQCMSALRGP